MIKELTNPATNSLADGISIDKIKDSIKHSGYPLQTIIAETLESKFLVHQEWSYRDFETESVRAIDILAERPLVNVMDRKKRKNKNMLPLLSLLIECKKSSLPYIFFLTKTKYIGRFPVITGLPNDWISIISDDTHIKFNYSLIQALGLENHPFLNSPKIKTSAIFTKCNRKGKELELSGSDPFNGLIIPLSKSLKYFKKVTAEKAPNPNFSRCHLTFAIAVIDAPMVSVEVKKGAENLEMIPWVRVTRHLGAEEATYFERAEVFAFDIVHKDYFNTYLNEHLMPFANLFGSLAEKHELVLTQAKAFATGMFSKGFANIEERLKPIKSDI